MLHVLKVLARSDVLGHIVQQGVVRHGDQLMLCGGVFDNKDGRLSLTRIKMSETLPHLDFSRAIELFVNGGDSNMTRVLITDKTNTNDLIPQNGQSTTNKDIIALIVAILFESLEMTYRSNTLSRCSIEAKRRKGTIGADKGNQRNKRREEE